MSANDEAITTFTGAYRFLSNFYPCAVTFDGIVFPSAEHAYQAAKTLNGAERQWMSTLATAAVAKRCGRTLPLRADWEDVKLDVMRAVLASKFAAPHLAAALLITHPRALIEGNTWHDVYWGVCNGVGENWLGKLLMERREALRR